MKFIIIHGAFGSPEGNWFPELKERLEALEQDVIAPQFPVENWGEITRLGPNILPKHQSLHNWLKVFEKEILTKIKKGEKICMIGHSLGPVFILHAADKYNLKLDSAIFVSPFMEALAGDDWQFNNVNKTFYKTDFDFINLKKLIPLSYVVYSPDDPYVDKKFPMDFAQKMGSSQIPVIRAGHLNSEVNLNEFPLVFELCKSRIDLSLYQQYMAHRRELFAVNYVKGRSEEIIFLDPKEVADEGIFHFRNLRKGGFCTLFTATEFWDGQNKYMIEARKAAKRTGNLIRVYVVVNKNDLKRKGLLEQINLDIKNGVKVYFIDYKDLIISVPEADFGIWDDDYVCTVHYDKNNSPSEVQLSSRKKDIEEALKWKDKILKIAKRDL